MATAQQPHNAPKKVQQSLPITEVSTVSKKLDFSSATTDALQIKSNESTSDSMSQKEKFKKPAPKQPKGKKKVDNVPELQDTDIIEEDIKNVNTSNQEKSKKNDKGKVKHQNADVNDSDKESKVSSKHKRKRDDITDKKKVEATDNNNAAEDVMEHKKDAKKSTSITIKKRKISEDKNISSTEVLADEPESIDKTDDQMEGADEDSSNNNASTKKESIPKRPKLEPGPDTLTKRKMTYPNLTFSKPEILQPQTVDKQVRMCELYHQGLLKEEEYEKIRASSGESSDAISLKIESDNLKKAAEEIYNPRKKARKNNLINLKSGKASQNLRRDQLNNSARVAGGHLSNLQRFLEGEGLTIRLNPATLKIELTSTNYLDQQLERPLAKIFDELLSDEKIQKIVSRKYDGDISNMSFNTILLLIVSYAVEDKIKAYRKKYPKPDHRKERKSSKTENDDQMDVVDDSNNSNSGEEEDGEGTDSEDVSPRKKNIKTVKNIKKSKKIVSNKKHEKKDEVSDDESDSSEEEEEEERPLKKKVTHNKSKPTVPKKKNTKNNNNKKVIANKKPIKAPSVEEESDASDDDDEEQSDAGSSSSDSDSGNE